MAPAMGAAVTCLMMAALATAKQLPLTQEGCKDCRLGRDVFSDSSWEPPTDQSRVHEAGSEGGLAQDDTVKLLSAIEEAATQRGSYIATITDTGMLDLTQNMLRSLDAVSSEAPRLVVGLGSGVCRAFWGLTKTTCVEVFQAEDSISEDKVDWGSHDYWQVAFRKHAILTVIAMSNLARHIVYTDPDIVFLGCPVTYLVNSFGDTHDIVFSSNNMLDPNAESVDDVAETYENRGLANIFVGPRNRHADINPGLLLMSSSEPVSNLMLKALHIFKEQELVQGHYQQFSLVKALDEVPDIRVGVAPGDKLVNGNVFWGHRKLLPHDVVSVHANWMQADLKITCLRVAGLWVDEKPQRITTGRWVNAPAATMDSGSATVESCDDKVQAQVQELARPSQPGCYLLLPSGCRLKKFHAQDAWRLMYDLKSGVQCDVVSKVYNGWCGVSDAKTLFVEPVANEDKAPRAPGETGCYVWMPSGCQKHEFHATKWWRKTSETDYPTSFACTANAAGKFNKWCGNKDAQVMWVPPAPAMPSEPGCYAWLPTGCKSQAWGSADGWIHDIWGEKNTGAITKKSVCEEQRKEAIEKWCKVSNVRMAFVKDPSQPEPASEAEPAAEASEAAEAAEAEPAAEAAGAEPAAEAPGAEPAAEAPDSESVHEAAEVVPASWVPPLESE